jgi:glycosyltransferase involved in cell wall biosynthesis
MADRWLFGIYSWIIAPSRSSAKEVKARTCGERLPTVGHLYYPTIGEPPSPNRIPEANDGGPWDGPIDLWMIGRVEYGHKNNLAALDALEILNDAGRDVSLTVVGDGPDMADFVARSRALGVAGKIKFLGWRVDPWETVPKNAMIFIPSTYESMSLVAREAMMKGIRLTASPIPVFHEWIPGRLIADDFSVRAFAEKVVDVQSLSKGDLLSLYATALGKFSDRIFVESFMDYTKGKR